MNAVTPSTKPIYPTQYPKPVPVITDAMREYSQNRTKHHIALVVVLGEKLGFDFSQHDASKFSPALADQYVLIDNSYRTDLYPPIPYTDEMADASFQHIKTEPHHAEFWDEAVTKRNPEVDQNGNDVDHLVDATEMTVPALCEMVCDWTAMSIEIGGSPINWARVNTVCIDEGLIDDSILRSCRWGFTSNQLDIIYAALRMIWDPDLIPEYQAEAEYWLNYDMFPDEVPDQGPNIPSFNTMNTVVPCSANSQE